jgi:hypothetical protein
MHPVFDSSQSQRSIGGQQSQSFDDDFEMPMAPTGKKSKNTKGSKSKSKSSTSQKGGKTGSLAAALGSASGSGRSKAASANGNLSLGEQPLGSVFHGLGKHLGLDPLAIAASSSSSAPPPLAFNAGFNAATMASFERRCSECRRLAFSLVWRDTSSTYLAQRKKKGGEKSNAKTERARTLQV